VQLAFVNDAAMPYRPAGHCAGVTAPASQYDPGGHGRVHSSPSPNASLNVPAVQLVHESAPRRLYRPCGHCIAVGTTEPGGHAYPALHAPLQEGKVRAGAAPNRPPGHSPLQLGVCNAGMSPNRPEAHSEQPPAPVIE
jgi:hypothetical protein